MPDIHESVMGALNESSTDMYVYHASSEKLMDTILDEGIRESGGDFGEGVYVWRWLPAAVEHINSGEGRFFDVDELVIFKVRVQPKDMWTPDISDILDTLELDSIDDLDPNDEDYYDSIGLIKQPVNKSQIVSVLDMTGKNVLWSPESIDESPREDIHESSTDNFVEVVPIEQVPSTDREQMEQDAIIVFSEENIMPGMDLKISFVALQGGVEVVGAVADFMDEDHGTYFFDTVVVGGFQRQGIGKQLIDAAMKKAKELNVTVEAAYENEGE